MADSRDSRQLSRDGWSFNSPNTDAINTGSLQRIADATEKMAVNYVNLQNERDRYLKWYNEERARTASLNKKISSLRGNITKLKKQLEAK